MPSRRCRALSFIPPCGTSVGVFTLTRVTHLGPLFSTEIPNAPRCAIACCCETLLFFFRLLLVGSGGRDGLGPHHAEHTPSRPIWEVKQRRARLVLAWVTGWEYRVSKPPFGFGLRFRQCDWLLTATHLTYCTLNHYTSHILHITTLRQNTRRLSAPDHLPYS